MTNRTLTILDITGIQNYIFGSNRLRENIGASFLVEQATSQWLHDALSDYKHNLSENGQEVKDPTDTDTNADKLQAEVVYRGGGNIVILFDTLEQAQTSVSNLNKIMLVEAPGLEIAAAHIEFDWDTRAVGGIDGVYNELLNKLAEQKQVRRPSTPLLGQSVTLGCHATGLPAVAFAAVGAARDEKKPLQIVPVSAEIDAKVNGDTGDKADDRLRHFLGLERRKDYRLSLHLDELGRSHGESSYIALVHADGNNMGVRFKKLVDQYDKQGQNGECIVAIRELSRSVETASRTALQATVESLIKTLDALPEDKPLKKSISIPEDKRDKAYKYYLPFRPLVFGGDDVTFVCDGRLGLSLAATYLTAFEQATTNLPGGPAYACAGVAIVKAHYPFARAYALCEELCRNAKQMAKDVKEKHDKDASAMDWHFALSGPIGSIAGIRERSDVSQNGQDKRTLWMRPITLKKSKLSSWRHWDTLHDVLIEFNIPKWQERRNKLLQLQEKLRKGPGETEYFRKAFSLPCLPKPKDISEDQSKTGWIQEDESMLRCVYFDAIEALDFYTPIHSREE
ncbi:MAG: hypothetical protein AAGF95_31950 [Chloroflexota bacterium]